MWGLHCGLEGRCSKKPRRARSCGSRKSYVTRGWLKGLVDIDNFPNVHPSYTREEAMNQPSQVMFPDGFF